MILTTISSTADILGDPAEPRVISQKDSQLLYGEQFKVEEEHGAYLYGHSLVDGYKGYVEREQLRKEVPPASHFVAVRSTHIYPEPSFKSRPLLKLSFLSKISTLGKTEGDFTQIDDGNLDGTENWIFTAHLSLIDGFKMPEQDLAGIANMYLGTPYLYGGRSSFGIDCAGLVQQAVRACGYDCPPRDSCDQEDSFGLPADREDIKRNDVVYFRGHVGIMMDEFNIVNATARKMTTLVEPLDILEKAYGGITHIARL